MSQYYPAATAPGGITAAFPVGRGAGAGEPTAGADEPVSSSIPGATPECAPPPARLFVSPLLTKLRGSQLGVERV
jgi:hypothetical protein